MKRELPVYEKIPQLVALLTVLLAASCGEDPPSSDAAADTTVTTTDVGADLGDTGSQSDDTGLPPDMPNSDAAGATCPVIEFSIHGHRAARGLKPENTLPAVEAALDHLADTLELDLHYSVDGEIIVWHDAGLRSELCRLPADAGGSVPDPDAPGVDADTLLIRSLTAESLSLYRCDRLQAAFPEQDAEPTALAGDDYHVMTLGEVFDFVDRYAADPGRTEAQRLNARCLRYNLESKRKTGDSDSIGDGFDGSTPGDFERTLVDLVEARGLVERVVIQSFDEPSLQAVRELNPALRLSILTREIPTDFGVYFDSGYSVWSPLSAWARNERAVANAHEAGLEVIPWTVNTLVEMEVFIAAGVDGLITDRPDLAAQLP